MVLLNIHRRKDQPVQYMKRVLILMMQDLCEELGGMSQILIFARYITLVIANQFLFLFLVLIMKLRLM